MSVSKLRERETHGQWFLPESMFSGFAISERMRKLIRKSFFRYVCAILLFALIPECLPEGASNCFGQSERKEGDGRNAGQRKGPTNKNSQGKGGSGLGNYTEPPPANNVPEHLYDIILGRPTDNGISIRVLFHRDATAHVVYGKESGKLSERMPVIEFQAKEPRDFVLDKLQPNSRYYYKLVYRTDAGNEQS